MNQFPLPRLLTATELQTVKANHAANRAIFEDAGWFIPIPDGDKMSEMGDKSVAYVNDARDILTSNQAELGALVPLDKLVQADDLHDQAQLLEDEMRDLLVAPTNISMIAGAIAKGYADDLYNILKGLVRVSAKWVDSVKRLAARYERGPRPPKP